MATPTLSASTTTAHDRQGTPLKIDHVRNATPLQGWACASIGGMSGVIEVLVNQPTVSWKNALQQARPLSFKPSEMYRGTFVNAASIAPITAIQFGVAGFLTELVPKSFAKQHQEAIQLSTALAGGAVSGLIVCPADMLIIQQQRTGLTLVQQYSSIVSSYGILKLSKGLVPAICRESLFVGGYLGLAPVLRSAFIRLQPSTFKEGDFLSLISSSILAGITAGVLTHPIDCVKTRLQAELAPTSVYQSSLQTARLLYADGGIGAFYKGLLPRTGRICVAVLIFNECNRLFSSLFRRYEFGLVPQTIDL